VDLGRLVLARPALGLLEDSVDLVDPWARSGSWSRNSTTMAMAG
jgi:hypothetical protein